VPAVIVGVDESGDFRDGSRGWFLAAFIRPATLPIVEGALREWERATRRRLGLTNEIKGAQLDNAAAEAFVRQVAWVDASAPVRWVAHAVDIDEDNRRAITVQRQLLADGYDRWAATQLASDDAERQRFGRVLAQHARWVRARGQQQSLKLLTLTTIIPEHVGCAFAIAMTNRFDEDLVELSIRIDRGYIKHTDLPMWRDVLRNAFIDVSRKRPLPFSDQWGPDHPVIQAFVERGRGSSFEMRPSFKDRIDFYDSASSPVVRVADVMVAILRLGVDGGPLAGALRLLRETVLGTHLYTLLAWSDEAPERGPNPYEAFRSDPSS
jgi:hypothetical protein